MLFDLFHRGHVDHRSLLGTFGQAVGHLELQDGGGEFGGEGVIDAFLNQQAIDADAGLAGIAVFRGHRAGDRRVEIGILEDDERRVAAEFHRNLLDRGGTLGHQHLADFGGPGESDFLHRRIAGEFATDGAGRAGHDVHHARGYPRLPGQFGQRQGRVGRHAGRLDHDGATGGQGRSGLAGDHGVGEVPWRDRGDHAHRLLNHHDAAISVRTRDGVAVDPLGFLGKPFDEGCAVGNLAARFGKRFALLQGHDPGQVFLVVEDQFVPAAQDARTLLGAAAPPGREGRGGGGDGATRFSGAHLRHGAELVAVGRVADRQRRAVVGVRPGAGYVGLLAEELGVVEFEHGSPRIVLSMCRQ